MTVDRGGGTEARPPINFKNNDRSYLNYETYVEISFDCDI